MTMITEQLELRAANDATGSSDPVSANQASRRAERRLMLVIACLTVAVLVSSLADGYIMAQAMPDLTTFAGRV